MFKNVIVYRIGEGWTATLAQIEGCLDAERFVPCGASQDKSVGWVEPRGEAHGPLVESVAGQLIVKLKIETKAVPGSVVARKAKERSDQIEATTGRKPGKKEMRDIKDDVRMTLMPLAFSKESSVWVWIDTASSLLIIDAGSQAKADEVITRLVSALPGLSVMLLNTQMSPQAAMTAWLITQEPPSDFSVDRECELKAADESKSVVRYVRHALDTEEVKQHVEGGKLPTRLALTWNSRVSFVLTEALQLKKVTFLDVVFEATSSEKDEGFDADVAIATGELCQLLPDLIEALGGEMVLG
ncbi:recombination-associated protein RdgC [Limnohabitans sp.]|uniref:recombination-associated protein RdgC n=1 Tax=Limnohabitans sp. TaxID=1907725 RepID=UPI0038B8EAE4